MAIPMEVGRRRGMMIEEDIVVEEVPGDIEQRGFGVLWSGLTAWIG